MKKKVIQKRRKKKSGSFINLGPCFELHPRFWRMTIMENGNFSQVPRAFTFVSWPCNGLFPPGVASRPTGTAPAEGSHSAAAQQRCIQYAPRRSHSPPRSGATSTGRARPPFLKATCLTGVRPLARLSSQQSVTVKGAVQGLSADSLLVGATAVRFLAKARYPAWIKSA